MRSVTSVILLIQRQIKVKNVILFGLTASNVVTLEAPETVGKEIVLTEIGVYENNMIKVNRLKVIKYKLRFSD